MPEDVNRETVERRRDRLLDEYGEVRVHEEREVVDADRFVDLRDFARDGYTGGGYAWVVRRPEQAIDLTESMPDEVDEQPAVLMILGRGGDRWGLPGGGREAGETYEEAAVREVHEETGVDCELTGVWQVKRRRFVHREDPERRGYLLSVFFTAAYAGGEADRYPERWDEDADEEILDVEWFDELPENAAGYVTDPDVPERDAVNDS